MENPSGLRPKGHALLVQPIEIEQLKAELIHIPADVRKTSAAMEHRAKVIEIGGECWADEKEPRCKEGDIVMVTKFAGFVAVGPKDKVVYRLVNDRDVFCVVEA